MNRKPPIYGVTRIDNENSRTHGWLVTIQRRGIIFRKQFSDGVLGGKAKSLAAAKAYRDEVLDELTLYGELHRYIQVLAHVRGFRVAEVAVPHRPRRYGNSKFGPARFFRGFFDLLTVLFLSQYTRRPLHLFGLIGAVTFGVGFLIDAYLAFVKLALGQPIGHRPLLTLGVLLIIVGTQFIVFGLLGEMIAHHAHVSNAGGRTTDYSIRRILRHDPPAHD